MSGDVEIEPSLGGGAQTNDCGCGRSFPSVRGSDVSPAVDDDSGGQAVSCLADRSNGSRCKTGNSSMSGGVGFARVGIEGSSPVETGADALPPIRSSSAGVCEDDISCECQSVDVLLTPSYCGSKSRSLPSIGDCSGDGSGVSFGEGSTFAGAGTSALALADRLRARGISSFPPAGMPVDRYLPGGSGNSHLGGHAPCPEPSFPSLDGSGHRSLFKGIGSSALVSASGSFGSGRGRLNPCAFNSDALLGGNRLCGHPCATNSDALLGDNRLCGNPCASNSDALLGGNRLCGVPDATGPYAPCVPFVRHARCVPTPCASVSPTPLRPLLMIASCVVSSDQDVARLRIGTHGCLVGKDDWSEQGWTPCDEGRLEQRGQSCGVGVGSSASCHDDTIDALVQDSPTPPGVSISSIQDVAGAAVETDNSSHDGIGSSFLAQGQVCHGMSSLSIVEEWGVHVAHSGPCACVKRARREPSLEGVVRSCLSCGSTSHCDVFVNVDEQPPISSPVPPSACGDGIMVPCAAPRLASDEAVTFETAKSGLPNGSGIRGGACAPKNENARIDPSSGRSGQGGSGTGVCGSPRKGKFLHSQATVRAPVGAIPSLGSQDNAACAAVLVRSSCGCVGHGDLGPVPVPTSSELMKGCSSKIALIDHSPGSGCQGCDGFCLPVGPGGNGKSMKSSDLASISGGDDAVGVEGSLEAAPHLVDDRPIDPG